MTAAKATRTVDAHPLLVATVGEHASVPGLTAIVGSKVVGAEVATVSYRETVVDEVTLGIEVQNGVGAKDSWLEDPGESPGLPAILGVPPSRLAKIAGDGVKLSPADGHSIRVRGINGDGGLVGSIADDVVALRIHVHLDAQMAVAFPDHRRLGHPVGERNRDVGIIQYFEVTGGRVLVCRWGCRLEVSRAQEKQRYPSDQGTRFTVWSHHLPARQAAYHRWVGDLYGMQDAR